MGDQQYRVMARHNGMDYGEEVILDDAEQVAWAGEIERGLLVRVTDSAVDTITHPAPTIIPAPAPIPAE